MTAFNRRHLLAGAAMAATAAASPPRPTSAQPAMREGQPPSFRRFALGQFEVTCLFDGGMQMPAANIPRFFPDADLAELERLRDKAFRLEEGLHQPVGSYLVNTGRNLILVDSGGHPAVMVNTGRMMEAFRATGYRPEDVDTVLLTHVHPEHALGLVGEGGTRAFPKALVWLTEEDHALWTAENAVSRVPQGQRFVDAALRALAPYRGEHTRLYPMNRTQEIVPGVTVVPGAGHTPGHVAYRFSSGASQMLIWGDVTHQTVIQLAKPRWRLGIDVDADAAVTSRLRTLDMLATDRILVGGVHLPWPGVGRIVREGPESYAYVPRPWQFA